jgi:hypothetical protein
METAYWLEYWPGKVSRAEIVTGYDVYHLPPPYRSETQHLEWRYHIPWAEWAHTPDTTRRGELIEAQRYIEALRERD